MEQTVQKNTLPKTCPEVLLDENIQLGENFVFLCVSWELTGQIGCTRHKNIAVCTTERERQTGKHSCVIPQGPRWPPMSGWSRKVNTSWSESVSLSVMVPVTMDCLLRSTVERMTHDPWEGAGEASCPAAKTEYPCGKLLLERLAGTGPPGCFLGFLGLTVSWGGCSTGLPNFQMQRLEASMTVRIKMTEKKRWELSIFWGKLMMGTFNFTRKMGLFLPTCCAIFSVAGLFNRASYLVWATR